MNTTVKEFKDVMERAGLSVEQAAHYLHLSGNTLRRWMAGTNKPNQTSVRRIKDAILRIKTDYPDTTGERIFFSMLLVFCPVLEKLSDDEKDLYEQTLRAMTGGQMKRHLFYIGIDKERVGQVIERFAEESQSYIPD